MNISFPEKKGKIVFNEFSIKDTIPLSEQINDLKEDMLQIEFPNNFILDVGWRPSFDINGKFFIYLIKNFDWSAPVYYSNAKDLPSLYNQISLAINKIE